MLRASLCALLLLAVTPAGAADYDKGVTAFDRGDFARALAELKPLTERGHDGAEFMLGAMYFYGKGVPSDPSAAAVWFAKAARQGNPGAQLAFGSLHIRGIGVKQDLVKAHMWLSLAAASELPGLAQQAIILRDDAARLMTPEERDTARRLAESWKPLKAGFIRKE
jgi:TPR repeat protein